MPWVSFENEAQLNGFIKRLDENGMPYSRAKKMNKDGLSVFSSDKSAALLSQHIRDFYEEKMIQYIYHRRYQGFSRKLDDQRVCEISSDLAHKDENIEKALESEIFQLMEKFGRIFVKGVTDFRLKRYKDALEENIEKGIESYAHEREAESFIDLLKYFVSIQEPQYRLVHIVCEQGVYSVFDEQYQEIHYDAFTELRGEAFEDVSSSEDWLLSVLITIAPQKIILHNVNSQVPENFLITLEKVFEKRLKICDGCSYCKNFLLKN